MEIKKEIATFGAGCFWGVEEAFRKVPGVINTVVGYSGGEMENPSYEDVCTDKTGHVEVVQVEFDPKKVGYSDLIEVFWYCHDPTQVNRQGPDVGSQYRSAIFYHSNSQKEMAEESQLKHEQIGSLSAPIATEITKAGQFYRAEEYHQKYLMKQGKESCHI